MKSSKRPMTRILLVRHALSQGNVLKICCGHLDLPLEEKGLKQAALLAQYLKKTYPVEAVYSSDLSRAVQTAQPTADLFGLPLLTDPDLKEVNAGELQGMRWEQLNAQSREVYSAWNAMTRGRYPLLPRGAETCEEVGERMSRAMKRIARDNPDKCVVVVSHSRAIRTLLDFWREGFPTLQSFLEDWKGLGSASVTELLVDPEKGLCQTVMLNYKEHLTLLSTNAME